LRNYFPEKCIPRLLLFNDNKYLLINTMKKIVDYRKLLGVNEAAELQELKTTYRSLMKAWHPDKFQDSPESKLEAEEKSKTIIEAYHFLVSIAPETREQSFAEYTITTTTSSIADFEYKSQVLKISFADGNTYEYFDVPKAVYVKLINADSPGRFARRHIYNDYVYRSISRLVATA
jgi:curved DNA-binding protein CbpA